MTNRTRYSLSLSVAALAFTTAPALADLNECASGICRISDRFGIETGPSDSGFADPVTRYRNEFRTYSDSCEPVRDDHRCRNSNHCRLSDWHGHRNDSYDYGHSLTRAGNCPGNVCRFDREHGRSNDRTRHRFRETSFENFFEEHSGRNPLPDPFRAPRNNRSGEDRALERRYRIPFRDSLTDGNFDTRQGLDFHRPTSPWESGDFDPLTPARSRDRDLDRRFESEIEHDPLTPALPRRSGGSEADALFEKITLRYQNPSIVRSVRSLSADQAMRLYREVSAQTDSRHLEPSTYDLRVRRALRNLGLALDNPAFTKALRIPADSFQAAGFRDFLSRTWDRLKVDGRSNAEQILQSVMHKGQSVRGLSPGVIAFEFANATVDTLDKFSALEPAEPSQSPSAALESRMVGIGVEVKHHEDGLLVVRALRSGPAAEAGLQADDIITAINRRSIAGMPISQSVDLIKGRSGSSVALQISRSGHGTRTFTLTRRQFRIWTVNDVRMVAGTDVGYVNLSQFAQTSVQELDQALKQLHRSGMKSLILDLRGNPGGLLATCVDISNRFLACGTIVSTKGRLESDAMHESATLRRTWSIPLVVLIDGDSASASEIFAAAIQENGRGVVVGEKSYGKGTVQTHFSLESISGNLRLTTARFYSPNGRPMSGTGVTPDVRVTDEDGVANDDRVLDRALQIVQSRQLEQMATAAGRCRTRSTAPQRNSFNGNMYDPIQPRTVLR